MKTLLDILAWILIAITISIVIIVCFHLLKTYEAVRIISIMIIFGLATRWAFNRVI